ncbi:MAG TPA: HDOD domain-containing protein [Verrucomicrobiae bacterium]
MSNANQFHLRHQPLDLDTVIALQFLNVFRDSDNDIDRVVEFISQHPVLAAETIRRCNNLKFHRNEYVTDIFEAVSRLGFYELYSIVSDTLTAQGLHPDSLADNAGGDTAWSTVPLH